MTNETLKDGERAALPDEVREALVHEAGGWRGAACGTRDDEEGERRSADYNRRAQVIEDWLKARVASPQSDDLVAVPRELLGSACHAIDKKRDAPATLEKLRKIAIHGRAASPQSGEKDREWVPEPDVEVVREYFAGRDHWDFKVFNRALKHGEKLYARAPAPQASLTDEQRRALGSAVAALERNGWTDPATVVRALLSQAPTENGGEQ